MRTALIGVLLIAVALALMPFGVIAPSSLLVLAERLWPVLLFVVAITVVTELAAEAQVFGYVAERAARWGRGRGWLLWLILVVLASLSTIFLSLDTTAVLLTPVVVVLARHVGLNPVPFAVTTVWLANTGSLLLPVSNLTNLLAQHRLGDSTPLEFATLSWAPAVAAIIVPAAVVFLIFRRSLLVPYDTPRAAPVADPVLFRWSLAVVLLLLPGLISGVAVWVPAVAAAGILLGVFAIRRPGTLRFALLPWPLVLLVVGLFLVVDAAEGFGLQAVLAAAAGDGESPAALLRLAAVGAGSANLVDNLPAYLALEPVASSPARLIGLLIGVNAGPLITPWASLATLLWHQRLVSLGVRISWRRYALWGALVAPLTVLAATAAVAWAP